MTDNKTLYNYHYELTYSHLDDNGDDTLYRRDMLNIFNVDFKKSLGYDIYDSENNKENTNSTTSTTTMGDENDDNEEFFKLDLFNITSKKAVEIFDKLPKDNELFNNICINSASRLFSCDIITGFLMLFSFELLYLQHQLLQHFFRYNELDNKILNDMNDKILTLIN